MDQSVKIRIRTSTVIVSKKKQIFTYFAIKLYYFMYFVKQFYFWNMFNYKKPS